MKKFFLSIIIFIAFSGAFYSQRYSDGGYFIQLQHKFNARSEAMGRGNAALTGETFYLLDNPASTSFMNGAGLSYTYLEPNLISQSFVNMGGLSYNTGKYGALGIIYQDYLYIKYDAIDIEDGSTEEIEISYNSFIANYSYKFNDDFSAGINGFFYQQVFKGPNEALFPNEDDEIKESVFLLDLGLLKKFSIPTSLGSQNIYAGLSVSNVLNSTLKSEGIELYFPVMLRAAGSYEIIYNPVQEKLTPLQVTICAEYEDNLIDQHFTRVKFGGEVVIFDILKLRAGHFDEFREFYREPFFPTGNVSRLTYGFGLSLPLHKISNIPWELNVDYTKQENTYYMFGFPEDFKLLTFNFGLKL